MVETTIQLKPREQWRPGMTPQKLIEELDERRQVPGLSNIWVPPIRNRIDMLATGIKSPLGIKVSGPDLAEIDRVGAGNRARRCATCPGVTSALAERLHGRTLHRLRVDRAAAARYGLNVADVQEIVAAAIGGENVGETVEGLQRFPINVRYPRETARFGREAARRCRWSPSAARRSASATSRRSTSPTGRRCIKSENARPSGWVYVDIRGRDLVAVVRDAQRAVIEGVTLAAGLFDRVVGTVRVPRARAGAAQGRRAVRRC